MHTKGNWIVTKTHGSESQGQKVACKCIPEPSGRRQLLCMCGGIIPYAYL